MIAALALAFLVQDPSSQAGEVYEAVLAILREMRSLAEKGTNQKEIDERISRIDAIADVKTFAGRKILQGTRPVKIQASRGIRPAGVPWGRIRDAVRRLEGGNQTVVFTYSFIISGTSMEKGPSLELKDHLDGVPSAAEFRQEIREALAVWEELFERTFSTAHGYGGNLELRFVELGDEKGTSFGSNRSTEPYPVPGRENLGDLRYGIERLGTTASPHSPMGRTREGMGDDGGDVHFDSGQDWRCDRSDRGGRTSVKIVAAHETGHGLALPHDETSTPMALMNPRTIVTGSFCRKFPDGLYFEGSSERAAIVALYGGEISLRTREPFRLSGVEIDLPSVSAATLGISALKVRTPHEKADAIRRLAAAEKTLVAIKTGLTHE